MLKEYLLLRFLVCTSLVLIFPFIQNKNTILNSNYYSAKNIQCNSSVCVFMDKGDTIYLTSIGKNIINILSDSSGISTFSGTLTCVKKLNIFTIIKL